MNTSHIEKLREKFGAAPRKFSFLERMTTFHFLRPDWAYEEQPDNLNYLFDQMSEVYKNGEVIWGRIIQANSQLYEKGNDNLPGELVYTFDQDFRLWTLDSIGHQLFDLKSQSPEDPELRKISNYLKDEYIRVYGWSVPQSISRDLDCFISTTYFIRKHFLDKTVNGMMFPIVASKDVPHFALPLPCKYWTDEFKQWWLEQ